MPGNPNILSNSATPEMMGPGEGLPVFFHWAEKAHPEGVRELVGVIGSLMPEGGEAATEQGIRDGLTNSKLDMGFNVLSSWLTDVGAGGFRDINGAMRWGFLQAAKANKIRFPAKEKVAGREVQAVLKSFSATVKKAEAKGMGPVQIVGNLLQESVGSRLMNNGSGILRTELVKALGGEQNLTWLWMPLGIRDAARQAGSGQKESAAAAEVARVIRERTGLPAFLEGGRIPEGYDSKTLDPGMAEYIRFRQEWGNEMVVYVGNVGLYFKQPEKGKASFVFLGFNFPENVEPSQNSPDNVRLTGIGSDGIQLEEGRLAVELCRGTTDDPKPEPVVRATGLLRKVVLDLPSLYLNADGRQRYRDLDIPIFDLNIKVEGTWIVVTNNSSASKVRISSPRTDATAREKTPAEVELSINERAFMQELEALVKDELREDPISAEALRQNFTAMQGVFSWLPDAGTFRTEVMKEVVRQLGPEAEQLKESGKSESQIYDEWLKKVFAPLYRRVKTKP